MPLVIVKKSFYRKTHLVNVGEVLNVPDEILRVLGDHVRPVTPQQFVGEALAETDRTGRPWPRGFFQNLPAEDRQRLRELEAEIDAAVINNDAEALPGLLTDWRQLMLSKLN